MPRRPLTPSVPGGRSTPSTPVAVTSRRELREARAASRGRTVLATTIAVLLVLTIAAWAVVVHTYVVDHPPALRTSDTGTAAGHPARRVDRTVEPVDHVRNVFEDVQSRRT